VKELEIELDVYINVRWREAKAFEKHVTQAQRLDDPSYLQSLE
jgi:hypothetical protein